MHSVPTMIGFSALIAGIVLVLVGIPVLTVIGVALILVGVIMPFLRLFFGSPSSGREQPARDDRDTQTATRFGSAHLRDRRIRRRSHRTG